MLSHLIHTYIQPFILELLSDLRLSRKNNDIMMALAVLQQCTRKNVGGIMSDDLFSFTNCGEPKHIVSEFIDEVEITLHWLTEKVKERSRPPPHTRKLFAKSSKEYQKEESLINRELKTKVDQEQSKIFSHIIEWATLGILKPDDHVENEKSIQKNADIAAVTVGLIWSLVVLYSLGTFVREVSSGVMSPANHSREKYSCCCNV